MLRIVFDTNILVSVIIKHGKPRELWDQVIEGKVRLSISEELLAEFNDVIFRPKFKRYVTKRRITKFQRALIQTAEVLRVKIHFQQITKDPNDNMVLELAHSSRADYIVSGDKHLLTLDEFKGIRIVTVDQMIWIIKEKR